MMSTRERIVKEATKLFWRDGYHLVSTEAICRAAGVRRSSLYHAFPSKADLLAASLESVWERNWREILAINSADVPIEVKFKRHIAWYRDSQLRLRDESGVLLGTFDMALGVALPDAVAESMRSHKANITGLLQDYITQIICSRGGEEKHAIQASQIIGSIVVASNYHARLMNDATPLDQLPVLIEQVMSAFSIAPDARRKLAQEEC
jgi:TetR/AcrR family transcriptional regulator, transcriptional repressor for nem operon